MKSILFLWRPPRPPAKNEQCSFVVVKAQRRERTANQGKFFALGQCACFVENGHHVPCSVFLEAACLRHAEAIVIRHHNSCTRKQEDTIHTETIRQNSSAKREQGKKAGRPVTPGLDAIAATSVARPLSICIRTI